MNRIALPLMSGIPQNSPFCYDLKKGKCMHWYPTKDGAYCSLLKVHSLFDHHAHNLIWDQIKECGISTGEDNE
jgi:hypothetical protein